MYLTRLLRTFNIVVCSILLKVPSPFHLLSYSPTPALCWLSSHPTFHFFYSFYWFLFFFLSSNIKSTPKSHPYLLSLYSIIHSMALYFLRENIKFISVCFSYIHGRYAEKHEQLKVVAYDSSLNTMFT